MSAPWWLELEVSMDRIPCVVYPCLVCGGRGLAAIGVSCARCGDSGEEPAGVARNVVYGLGSK